MNIRIGDLIIMETYCGYVLAKTDEYLFIQWGGIPKVQPYYITSIELYVSSGAWKHIPRKT